MVKFVVVLLLLAAVFLGWYVFVGVVNGGVFVGGVSLYFVWRYAKWLEDSR